MRGKLRVRLQLSLSLDRQAEYQWLFCTVQAKAVIRYWESILYVKLRLAKPNSAF
jgi:hypothetical protein